MRNLRLETEANFKKFDNLWQQELKSAASFYASQQDKFLASYRRVASLQAWRSSLLENCMDAESLRFFLEAQNDALCSHVFARMGTWRSALKSLRSMIENVLAALYYKDHPVELILWKSGDHRMSFKDYMAYFSSHPAVRDSGEQLAGIAELKDEYGTLSRAVHASAEPFRMTGAKGETMLWIMDQAKLGKWGTREYQGIAAVNKLLLVMFASELQGAAIPALRKSISFAISSKDNTLIKSKLKVSLYT